MSTTHDAFISYSHAADHALAPAVERGLEKLAKPLLKLRALDVFRDQSSLTATPALWPAIVDHLSGSAWFLLMASPASAASTWCNKEVEWWLTHRSHDRLLILLTDGEAVWDASGADFDWTRTTAISPTLARRFPHEPLYVDLRWTRPLDSLSLAHPRFREVIVDIAAPLRGMRKDELDSADVRQYRRNRRFVRGGIAAIMVAAVIAVWQAIAADQARREAERQRDEAIAGRLTSDARSARFANQVDLSLLLARASLRVTPTPQASFQLLSMLAQPPYPVAVLDAASPINAVAVTSDGHLLAAGAQSGTVTVWDTTTWRPILEPDGSGSGTVRSLAFSRDGALLAVGDVNGQIRLWDVDAKRWHEPLKTDESPVLSVAFSADSRWLASGGQNGTLLLWDVRRRIVDTDLAAPLREPGGGFHEIQDVAFSADGHLLAAAIGSEIVLWDAAARVRVGTLSHASFVVPNTITFSNDGSMLAVGDNGSGLLAVWELNQKRWYDLGRHRTIVGDVAFRADNKVLASVGIFDRRVSLWDVEGDGDAIGEPIDAHADGATGVAFLGDGGRFVTAGRDGKAIVWAPASMPVIAERVRQPIEWISRAAFSPDGRYLLLGDDRGVVVWDVQRQVAVAPRLETGAIVEHVLFDADGQRLIAATFDTLFEWNLRNREATGQRRLLDVDLQSNRAFEFSPDGALAAIARGDQFALLETATGAVRAKLANQKGISQFAFSRNGTRLVSAAEFNGRGRVSLWDIRAQPQVVSAIDMPGSVAGMAFRRDGRRLVVALGTGRVLEWDTETPVASELLTFPATPITSMAITADDRRAAVGTQDGDIVLIDLESRALLGPPLSAHGGLDIQRISFEPSTGRTLLSESQDGRVVLWDVSLDSWLERACEVARRNLTCEESRAHLRGVVHDVSCGGIARPHC